MLMNVLMQFKNPCEGCFYVFKYIQLAHVWLFCMNGFSHYTVKGRQLFYFSTGFHFAVTAKWKRNTKHSMIDYTGICSDCWATLCMHESFSFTLSLLNSFRIFTNVKALSVHSPWIVWSDIFDCSLGTPLLSLSHKANSELQRAPH